MKPAACSRRTVLATGVSLGTAAVSGCLFASDPLGPGILVIDNDKDRRVDVTVTAKLLSSDVELARNDPATPSGDEDPLWSRESTVEVNGEQRVVKEDFVTEPGSYYVVAEFDDGRNASGWAGVLGTGDGDMSSGYIEVEIRTDGDVHIRRGVEV